MADRLSDEDLGDLERLAERAGRHAPLGPWSSEALLRLIAEVRELRAALEKVPQRAWEDGREDGIIHGLELAARHCAAEMGNVFEMRARAASIRALKRKVEEEHRR